jgi:hypothetical protein
LALAASALALAGGSGIARADFELHGGAAASGLLRLDAPTLGVAAALTLYPEGLWGVRAEAVHVGGVTLVEGQVARGLGATWRHLILAVHAGAGVETTSGAAVIAGGFSTDLGLPLAPLGLELDLGVHQVLGHDLVLTATLGLALLF